MSRLRIFFGCVLICLGCVIPAVVYGEPLAEHVILISVDGFRPEFYLDESWPAPMIQQMAREGVSAERVRSVFPSVTYPSHTTIVTGALPARHGIYYNTPFETGGQTGRWYWETEAIQVPTLWSALRKARKKTAVVSWPVTVGAPIDWLVPEIWSLDTRSDRLAPMRENTSPRSLWHEIEREATGKLTMETYSAAYISRDLKTAAAAAYIFEKYRPSLIAMHLISPDHFMHQTKRDTPIVRRALATCDAGVNTMVEAAQRAGVLDATAIIVTGDHGFVNTHIALAPNVWLAEEGLMEAKRDRGKWRATFHGGGGSMFLHLKDPGDAAALKQVKRILDAAPSRIKKLFRVIEGEDLKRSGANPNVELALAAELGVSFTSRADGEVLAETSGAQHGYFPSDFPEIYTGFVGWGAGFKAGERVHLMGLEDIAPLIARLLDFPFDAPDGVAPLGVLDLE